jgi:hypothetical protein
MRWIVSVEIIMQSEHTNGIEDLDHTDSIKPVWPACKYNPSGLGFKVFKSQKAPIENKTHQV